MEKICGIATGIAFKMVELKAVYWTNYIIIGCINYLLWALGTKPATLRRKDVRHDNE
jgi:hypothetical protein